MAMSRSLGLRDVTLAPSIKMSPLVTSSRPAMLFIRVDLPQPDGPTRMRNSPSLMSRSMPFSTCVSPKDLVSC